MKKFQTICDNLCSLTLDASTDVCICIEVEMEKASEHFILVVRLMEIRSWGNFGWCIWFVGLLTVIGFQI